jgi:hypothetical protein
MNAHTSGAAMADVIALSSPSGHMSKRAGTAAQARIADALFGPASGFAGFEHAPTTEEMRAGRIAQLERLLADWRRVYAGKLASGRQNSIKRAYTEAEAELSRLRS